MRKLRESIRNDPQKYEEQKRKERERYHARRKAGKIKGIHEISNRNQRKVRKSWRERSRRHYAKKKCDERLMTMLDDESPLPSPVSGPSGENAIVRSRSDEGKQKRRKNTHSLKIKIKELEENLKKTKKDIGKYRKRLHRIKQTKKDSPRKRVKKLLSGQRVSPAVKKNLLFSEVITAQIKENFNKDKCLLNKRNVVVSVCGQIVKKYRYLNYMKNLLSQRALNHIRCLKNERQGTERIEAIKNSVKDFLQENESSRMCPGKKDTVTLKKCKRQKRFLNDSLMNLHKIFLHRYPHHRISYSLFCKARPFWILIPKAKDRHTCLCSTHENMALIVSVLKRNEILKEHTPEELCKSVCCDSEYLREECLRRICNGCKSQKIVTKV